MIYLGVTGKIISTKLVFHTWVDCCGITVKADLILMCLDVTEKEILTKEFPIFNLAKFVKTLVFLIFSKSFEFSFISFLFSKSFESFVFLLFSKSFGSFVFLLFEIPLLYPSVAALFNSSHFLETLHQQSNFLSSIESFFLSSKMYFLKAYFMERLHQQSNFLLSIVN